MSLVLWYSIVAFQWRKVWNEILTNRGFLVFSAIFLLWIVKFVLMQWTQPLNTLSLFYGKVLSMAISVSEILTIRELLCFSGSLIDTVLFSKSRSFHLSLNASPLLIPVSLSSCKNTLTFLLQPDMSWSSSFSWGMKGSRSALVDVCPEIFSRIVRVLHKYLTPKNKDLIWDRSHLE